VYLSLNLPPLLIYASLPLLSCVVCCCRDFVHAFANHFDYLFGAVITEITVGLGPAGELRYPSYPEGDGRCAPFVVLTTLPCMHAVVH
jgi:hypothetical protein